MPNIETSLSRAQQKIQNRARIQARPATPEDHLVLHDQQLEEQQDMLSAPLPTTEDQGEESGYDPDLEQDTDVYTDMESVMLEVPKELSAQTQLEQLENYPRHVTFANQLFVETSSTPPPPLPPPLLTLSPQPSLEEPLPPPFLPPRTCSHLNNNSNTLSRDPNSVLPGLRLGKCTPPKTCGQGYDPPFLYPEFIPKNQKSRVNYILTLVDSLVLQMEGFGSLSLKPEKEATGDGDWFRQPSTGAIPKVRPADSEFSGFPKANRERLGSKFRSQSKGKHSKKTFAEQEVDYDMDYEFFMEQIEEFRANRIRGCGACAAGRTLDVIRGHLARVDYSDASILPTPKRRNIGRDRSSSSSGTATPTPNTRPCSPEGQRQATNKAARDLEQLLDPTTDWPANKKKESRQQRSTLENLFNLTPATPPTRITIVAGKQQNQKVVGGGGVGEVAGGGGVGEVAERGSGAGAVWGTGAFITYPAIRSKTREGTLKKRNK